MNYYSVKINSDQITQKLAAQIFNEITAQGLVRYFDYNMEGTISYNSRGLADIRKILETIKITNEQIQIQDEFGVNWDYLEVMDPTPKIPEISNHIKETKRFEF